MICLWKMIKNCEYNDLNNIDEPPAPVLTNSLLLLFVVAVVVESN